VSMAATIASRKVAALEKIGKKRWNKRMHEVVEIMATVVNYDALYIGAATSRTETRTSTSAMGGRASPNTPASCSIRPSIFMVA